MNTMKAADDRYVVAIPSAVTSFDAAPLTCAGVTTFKAVKVIGGKTWH